MLRLAKLLKELPDVNAGAIFYVPSRDHQQHLNPDEPYDYYTYYYFGEDVKPKSSWKHEKDYYVYNKNSMPKEWFSFYDYSDNTWKEYNLVETHDLLGCD